MQSPGNLATTTRPTSNEHTEQPGDSSSSEYEDFPLGGGGPQEDTDELFHLPEHPFPTRAILGRAHQTPKSSLPPASSTSIAARVTVARLLPCVEPIHISDDEDNIGEPEVKRRRLDRSEEPDDETNVVEMGPLGPVSRTGGLRDEVTTLDAREGQPDFSVGGETEDSQSSLLQTSTRLRELALDDGRIIERLIEQDKVDLPEEETVHRLPDSLRTSRGSRRQSSFTKKPSQWSDRNQSTSTPSPPYKPRADSPESWNLQSGRRDDWKFPQASPIGETPPSEPTAPKGSLYPSGSMTPMVPGNVGATFQTSASPSLPRSRRGRRVRPPPLKRPLFDTHASVIDLTTPSPEPRAPSKGANTAFDAVQNNHLSSTRMDDNLPVQNTQRGSCAVEKPRQKHFRPILAICHPGSGERETNGFSSQKHPALSACYNKGSISASSFQQDFLEMNRRLLESFESEMKRLPSPPEHSSLIEELKEKDSRYVDQNGERPWIRAQKRINAGTPLEGRGGTSAVEIDPLESFDTLDRSILVESIFPYLNSQSESIEESELTPGKIEEIVQRMNNTYAGDAFTYLQAPLDHYRGPYRSRLELDTLLRTAFPVDSLEVREGTLLYVPFHDNQWLRLQGQKQRERAGIDKKPDESTSSPMAVDRDSDSWAAQVHEDDDLIFVSPESRIRDTSGLNMNKEASRWLEERRHGEVSEGPQWSRQVCIVLGTRPVKVKPEIDWDPTRRRLPGHSRRDACAGTLARRCLPTRPAFPAHRYYQDSSGDVVDMAMAPGNRLIVGSIVQNGYNRDGNLNVYDLEHNVIGKLRHHASLSRGVDPEYETVSDVKMVNERWFASASYDKTMILWDIETLEPIQKIQAGSAIAGLAVHKEDSRFVAFGTEAGDIELLRLGPTGHVSSSFHAVLNSEHHKPYEAAVTSIHFGNGRSRRVLFASHDFSEDHMASPPPLVAFWDIERGTLLGAAGGVEETFGCTTVSRSGDLLAAGTDNDSSHTPRAIEAGNTKGLGIVYLFDVRRLPSAASRRSQSSDARIVFQVFTGYEETNLISFSHGDTWMSVSSTCNETKLFDMRFLGRPLATLPHDSDHLLCRGSSDDFQQRPCHEGVRAAIWTHDNLFVSGGADGVVRFWDPRRAPGEMELHSYREQNGAITSVAFNDEETILAVGVETGRVTVYGNKARIGRLEQVPTLVFPR